MAVKLHLFQGFANLRLGITSDTELGHLYEDTNSAAILAFAGEKVGVKQEWLQNSEGFLHFDLWGAALRRAKQLFPTVTDLELVADLERIANET